MAPESLREVFQDFLSMGGVVGVMFFSHSGGLVFEQFTVDRDLHPAAGPFFRLAEALEGEREADLVFEKGRVNVRRSSKGILVVVTERHVPGAMVRLNSDILLAALNVPKPAKGIRRFFRR